MKTCVKCGGDPKGSDLCPPCVQEEVLAGGRFPRCKRVYISGAITSDPGYKHKFEHARLELHRAGLLVLDPSTFTPKGHESFTWTDWMAYDLDVLNRFADAVYMLDGWTESKGACMEYEAAMKYRKDVYFQCWHDPEDLLNDKNSRVLAGAECR